MNLNFLYNLLKNCIANGLVCGRGSMNSFILLICALTVASVNGVDYCADGICPPGVKHIACNNDNVRRIF
jgi:hypothetical protein